MGILDLPPEIIDSVFGLLGPQDLARTSIVCQKFRDHAYGNILWQEHVNSNLPCNPITSPYPFDNFRQLYLSNYLCWFIPKYKLWFCDRHLTGQLMIVQYDQRRGVIEGYQLLAVQSESRNGGLPTGAETWLEHPEVHVHRFDPEVKLHLDRPMIKITPTEIVRLTRVDTGPDAGEFRNMRERFMSSPSSDPRFCEIVLSKALSDDLLHEAMYPEFPYGFVWPPPTIPSSQRVTGLPNGVRGMPDIPAAASPENWRPLKPSEVSDRTFRALHQLLGGGNHEMVTFSTLDPHLYSPTDERPWRGIWVGDYSAHGCEFLLVNQPDVAGVENEELLVRGEDESEAEFEERFRIERVYRGQLAAVKLTGDPNVPRGELTFVANDIGEEGFIRNATDHPFAGVRVVKSKGHIALDGFFHDTFIDSELLLISNDLLAQVWIDFGHVSYFQRVDIDKFLKPA